MVKFMLNCLFELELWLLSDRTEDMYVVAALHRDGLVQGFVKESRDLRVKKGVDVPGQVLYSSQPYWDKDYDCHDCDDPNFPRVKIAKKIGIKTAFGVPLPGK